MNDWQLLVYGVVGFGMYILSGASGGGAGFVMTPLAILLGLSPNQAVSTGKINGLAVAVGSLGGLRKTSGKVSWLKITAIMVLAFVVGLFVPFVIKALENDSYRIILGVLLLLMIPVMRLKKMGIKPSRPSLAKKGLGGCLVNSQLVFAGRF